LQEESADLLDALWVEAIGWLIQDQQGRSAHQRGGQPQPLPHSLRVGAYRSAISGAESDLLERGTDMAATHLSRDAVRPCGIE
jgi:hypothetical protein